MKHIFCVMSIMLVADSDCTFGDDSRFNVLLIVSEDNGPELGCYGDPYARTPNLDKLAAEGVRFENAFVPYSVCSPSRACFLTGLYPHQNGQIGLATHKFAMYDAETPNFASLFKAAGYKTGLIGKLHVNPESAFPFDFRAIPGANFNRKFSIQHYANEARKFFDETGEAPWFLSVNFPDAHLPFLKHANGHPESPLTAGDVKPMSWVGFDTPRLREQVANYYNCLERLDIGVGLLLGQLEESGAADRTIVFYIGDHGAQFPRGKGTVYEGGLRVPMIVRWPGIAKLGLVRNELVSTIDIFPTALKATNIEAPQNLTGRDLTPLLQGYDVSKWRKYLFGLTTGAFPGACYVQLSIRDEQYKLISNPRPKTVNHEARTYLDETHPNFVVSGALVNERMNAARHVQQAWNRWLSPPRYELYDLKNDPNEWTDLSNDPGYAAVRDRLVKALTGFQKQTNDPFLDQQNVKAFVNEQLNNRDLGYRKRKDFFWSYLETFPSWRMSQ